MSETKTAQLQAKIKPHDEVQKTKVPEGGIRIFIDENYHWVIKKIHVPVYKKLKQMIRAGKDSEGAQYLVNTLMVAGTCDAMNIEDVDILIGVENAVAEILDPVNAQVKKS